MAAIVNFIDTTLQAATARGVNLPTADIQLLPDSPGFHVAVDGSITPASITFTATLVDLEASALNFNSVGGDLVNVAAKSVSIAGASMPGTSATVIANVTVNGKLYTKACTIWKVQDGAPGTSMPGARGAGHYYAAGSAWTDALANVSVPSPKVVGDVVTISSGTFVMEKRWTGSAWVDNGVVIDGKVIVPQSITAGSIDTRGLSIRDSAGNIILAAGSALAPDYAAPGTQNSALVPSISAAQQAADAANTAIGNMSSDNVLSKGEKSDLILRWAAITGEASGIANQADALGVNRDAFWLAYYTLNNYLPAGWNNTTTDTVIDGPTFRANFADYYSKREALKNAMTAKAATTATADGLNVGLGGRNLIIKNSLPNDTSSFTSTYADGASGEGVVFAGPGNDPNGFSIYSGGSRGCVYVHSHGPVGARTDMYMPNRITVVPGQRYEAGISMSTHRCRSTVNIAWYDASGNYIREGAGTSIENYSWNVNYAESMPRSIIFDTAPGNAKTAMVFLRQIKTYPDPDDCFTFASCWYIGEALAVQTVGSPYSPGALEANDALYAISADGILDRAEKSSQVIPMWNDEGATWTSLRAQAVNFGLDVSPYDSAFYAASNYLSSLNPPWNDVTKDTTIDRPTFRTLFANLATARTAQQNAISTKAANLGVDLTLIGRGCTVTGTSATKTATDTGWNADVYSTQQFVNGAFASAKTVGNYYVGFGLNDDPATDSYYGGITLWFETTPDGYLLAWINSEQIWQGTYTAGDELYISYDEVYARWYKNGVLVKDRAIYFGDQLPLGFDSTFNTVGARLDKIRCGPFASARLATTANATANSALAGLSDKLSSTASNILRAPIAITTSGGVVVGSLTYDPTTGLRTGGSGVGTTPYGIIMHNGSEYTFAVNAATGGVFLKGDITGSNGIFSGSIRTANYAEDGSGNPTAGAKMDALGTAMKVASNGLQVGAQIFSDYWFRLLQGIDGSIAAGRVIWRGNNDSSTRGGAPNINCLQVTPTASQVLNANFQQVYHKFSLTPSSYSAYTDNLDSMQQIHVQLFVSSAAVSPFSEFKVPCPSRTYDGGTGGVEGTWAWGWRFKDAGAQPGVTAQLESNGVFTGYLRVRLANSYGWSSTQDFAPGTAINTALAKTTMSGSGGSTGGGSGGSGGGGGGYCPAPWVKVRLVNGTEVNAGSLHNGARVAAVDDNTMTALPNGGIVRDFAVIWALRYQVRLTDGEATEWSHNHRFATVNRGWVHVQDLMPGDHIMGIKACIVDTVLATGEGQVVSFRVEGAGTYFAGGMLCHNIKAPQDL